MAATAAKIADFPEPSGPLSIKRTSLSPTARANAVAIGRARAEAYARSLGLRVARIVAVSESGGSFAPPPMPMFARAEAAQADTKIVPGEQKLQVSLAMTFELQ